MLTIDQLFQPDQSGVGLNPNVPPPQGTWLANLLTSAQQLGLQTTSWQSGAPERTILSIAAVAFEQEDVIISIMAQGGFLDFAASGTVSTTALNGQVITQPVTPDPSIPSQNPDGAPGWLDALGQSFYEVFRLAATFATGPLAIANTTPTTLTYVGGNYHVANTVTGLTYVNPVDISIPTSVIAGGGGNVGGVIVSSGTPTTTIVTTGPHGLTVGDVVYFGTIVPTAPATLSGLSATFGVVTFINNFATFTVGINTTGTTAPFVASGSVYKCTSVNMQADVRGISSNASVGQVTTTVTQNAGVFVDNILPWSANNWESNQAYAARCRLKLGTLSPNGPRQAYQYFALTAQQILAAENPPVRLTNGAIARVHVAADPSTGTVTTTLASTSPASTVPGGLVTPGCSHLAVTGASNASPIVISTAFPSTLNANDAVVIQGVLGNTAANGSFTVFPLSATTFQLIGTSGSGAYTGGGFVDGGDLGEIDNLIQQNVVPDAITAVTQSATAFPVNIGATVYVPQAYLATYQTAVGPAMQRLFQTFDIGGTIIPPATNGFIFLSAVEGALNDVGVLNVGQPSYVIDIPLNQLTLNGFTQDLVYPSDIAYAISNIITISVIGV